MMSPSLPFGTEDLVRMAAHPEGQPQGTRNAENAHCCPQVIGDVAPRYVQTPRQFLISEIVYDAQNAHLLFTPRKIAPFARLGLSTKF
jgi:hypothetical protein